MTIVIVGVVIVQFPLNGAKIRVEDIGSGFHQDRLHVYDSLAPLAQFQQFHHEETHLVLADLENTLK